MNGYYLLARILLGILIGVLIGIITAPWLLGLWVILRELLLH